MKKSAILSGVLLAGLVAASPSHAQDARKDELQTPDDTSLSVTTGVDWSSGDYGTGSDTRILVVPLALRYKTGNLRVSVTQPWLRIDGSSAIVGNGPGGVIIDPNAPRTTRSGLGDLTVGAAYMIPEEKLGVGIDLSARVKLPTASRSKGLGTGKTDVTVGAELSRSFGSVTPFASIGYRMPGDPEGIDLRNAWTASGGASVAMGKAVLIASYDYRQSTSRLAKDSHELFGAYSTPLNDALNFTFYGSAGLSDGAPDYGVGGMITVRF